MTEEILCEPSDFVLTSNPPQYKCKNCGQTWFTNNKTPICVSPTPDSMELCKRERGTVPANCPKDPTDSWAKGKTDKVLKTDGKGSIQWQEDWEKEFDSMFDWADQVKDSEIERWKVMYGFTPNKLKSFISEVRQRAVEETLRAVYGLERGSIAYYAKSKGIEL